MNLKARVDIEIYEEWIAEFRRLGVLYSPYIEDIVWADSEENLYSRIKDYLKSHEKRFLDLIVKERRVKFKIEREKFDLLIERKEYHRLNSNKSIFKEDDKRIEQLRRNNPDIFFHF